MSWPTRKVRSTWLGERRRKIQNTATISPKPNTRPIKGDKKMKSTVTLSFSYSRQSKPAFATPAPTRPPISACDELTGMPNTIVIQSQRLAPIGAPAMAVVSLTRGSTSPLPMVSATWTWKKKAAMKLKKAAQITACFGESTRVETTVAIEFAASCMPFMKSNRNASATTTTTPTVRCPVTSGLLHEDRLERVRDVLALVDGVLDRLVDLLPLHNLERVGLAKEQLADRRAQRLVAGVLQAVDLDAVVQHAARLCRVLELGDRLAQGFGRLPEDVGEADEVVGALVDLIQVHACLLYTSDAAD